jgi:hypothetical protein
MELLTANQLADAIIERCRWEEDKLTEIIEKRLNFIFPTLSGMCEIAAKDIARSLLSAMTEEKK